MHKDLLALCLALDALASSTKSGSSETRTFADIYGWNFLSITHHDAAAVASNLATAIRSAKIDKLDAATERNVADFARRVQYLQAHTLPQFFGGNALQAVPAYLATLESMRQQLSPAMGWQTPDVKSMPPTLARRLKALDAELMRLEPDFASLQSKIESIQNASDNIQSLPVDLQELKDAKSRIDKLERESLTAASLLAGHVKDAKTSLDASIAQQQAASIAVNNALEAHKMSTSIGLGASFNERANSLRESVNWWMFLLIVSLALGGYIAHLHYEPLVSALTVVEPKWNTILMQVVVAAFGVGGPVWIAWLSSKQIGQRFRLAEDYAFKASVAKAYEGYRREAARIDPVLEAQLFASLLGRVDEAPLRLIESEAHGSPMHEFFNSKAFKSALETSSELKESFLSIFKQKTTSARPTDAGAPPQTGVGKSG